jgi:hypothetical protein
MGNTTLLLKEAERRRTSGDLLQFLMKHVGNGELVQEVLKSAPLLKALNGGHDKYFGAIRFIYGERILVGVKERLQDEPPQEVVKVEEVVTPVERTTVTPIVPKSPVQRQKRTPKQKDEKNSQDAAQEQNTVPKKRRDIDRDDSLVDKDSYDLIFYEDSSETRKKNRLRVICQIAREFTTHESPSLPKESTQERDWGFRPLKNKREDSTEERSIAIKKGILDVDTIAGLRNDKMVSNDTRIGHIVVDLEALMSLSLRVRKLLCLHLYAEKGSRLIAAQLIARTVMDQTKMDARSFLQQIEFACACVGTINLLEAFSQFWPWPDWLRGYLCQRAHWYGYVIEQVEVVGVFKEKNALGVVKSRKEDGRQRTKVFLPLTRRAKDYRPMKGDVVVIDPYANRAGSYRQERTGIIYCPVPFHFLGKGDTHES